MLASIESSTARISINDMGIDLEKPSGKIHYLEFFGDREATTGGVLLRPTTRQSGRFSGGLLLQRSHITRQQWEAFIGAMI